MVASDITTQPKLARQAVPMSSLYSHSLMSMLGVKNSCIIRKGPEKERKKTMTFAVDKMTRIGNYRQLGHFSRHIEI